MAGLVNVAIETKKIVKYFFFLIDRSSSPGNCAVQIFPFGGRGFNENPPGSKLGLWGNIFGSC